MADHHAISTNYGQGKKTLKSYVFGLGLSFILTILAFVMTGYHVFPTKTIFVLLFILAILQLVAQVTFFLRMNTSAEGKWNLMPFLFTIVIVLVLVVGSLWIMINLDYNMMH